MQQPHLRARIPDTLRIDVDPPWPTGQCGEEPRQILSAAIQPVVRHADDSFDPLSALGATTCQVLDQPVESRPCHSRLGCATAVVTVRGNNDAAVFMRSPFIDPQLIANTAAITLPV